VLWQHVCNIKYIYSVDFQNNIVRLDCKNNIVRIEFCTQITRLSGLKHGLCLLYCVSRTLLRVRLTVGVRRVSCCVRLVMGYVEGFVMCLRARRVGVGVTDLLFCETHSATIMFAYTVYTHVKKRTVYTQHNLMLFDQVVIFCIREYFRII